MTSINIEISEVGEQGTIYHANGRIESITLSAERAEEIGLELARLREENALLQKVLRETVSNVIDYLGNHALEHLQPVTNLIDTEAWHKATNSGAEFTADNQPIPDDILSGYTAEEKAQFANDWLAEMRNEAE